MMICFGLSSFEGVLYELGSNLKSVWINKPMYRFFGWNTNDTGLGMCSKDYIPNGASKTKFFGYTKVMIKMMFVYQSFYLRFLKWWNCPEVGCNFGFLL